METMPLYATNPNAPMIGGANVAASAPGTSLSTTNRTLLHHQQQSQFGSNGNGLSTGTIGRNGSAAMRGLAYNGESPPPEYNVVVHDTSKRHGFFTLQTIELLLIYSPTYTHTSPAFLIRATLS